MTIDEAIKKVNHYYWTGMDDYFTSEEIFDLEEMLKALKKHREFIDDFCEKSDTVSECCACRAYDYGICTDKDLARKRRERGEDGRE